MPHLGPTFWSSGTVSKPMVLHARPCGVGQLDIGGRNFGNRVKGAETAWTGCGEPTPAMHHAQLATHTWACCAVGMLWLDHAHVDMQHAEPVVHISDSLQSCSAACWLPSASPCRELGWDAATDRLLAASDLSLRLRSRTMTAAYNTLYVIWNAVMSAPHHQFLLPQLPVAFRIPTAFSIWQSLAAFGCSKPEQPLKPPPSDLGSFAECEGSPGMHSLWPRCMVPGDQAPAVYRFAAGAASCALRLILFLTAQLAPAGYSK